METVIDIIGTGAALLLAYALLRLANAVEAFKRDQNND